MFLLYSFLADLIVLAIYSDDWASAKAHRILYIFSMILIIFNFFIKAFSLLLILLIYGHVGTSSTPLTAYGIGLGPENDLLMRGMYAHTSGIEPDVAAASEVQMDVNAISALAQSNRQYPQSSNTELMPRTNAYHSYQAES